jgi:glycosyltransferase involved in cell wall biosynthesis
MNILHVIPSLGPVYGGPSKIVPELAQVLIKKGENVHIATTNANGDECLNVPLGVPVSLQGVPTYYFPRHLNERFTFSWPLSRWLWKHVPEYDLIHIHSVFSYSTAAASRIAYKYRIPYVVMPHGMLEPWALKYKGWKKKTYFQLLERENLNRASGIHAGTKAEMDNICGLGIKRPMFVVPNGLNLSEFENLPSRAKFEERYPEIRGKEVILFLGRIDPKKGLDILVKALAILNRKDVYLVIAGPDLIGYRKTIEAMIHENGLGAQVLFTGMLSGQEKQMAFSSADLFVLPSRSEGFAVAVIEAMASRLPVIISKGCNFPQVEEVKAGRIIPPEVQPLVQAILDLLENPNECKYLGNRGWDLVRNNYGWEEVASRLMEVYKDIKKHEWKSKAWASKGQAI